MASADEYRDYAAQGVALASKSSNPGDKARLVQMAQPWRDLAAKDDAVQNKSAGKDQDIILDVSSLIPAGNHATCWVTCYLQAASVRCRAALLFGLCRPRGVTPMKAKRHA
jgi:hypothetical protein